MLSQIIHPISDCCVAYQELADISGFKAYNNISGFKAYNNGNALRLSRIRWPQIKLL